MRRAVVTLAVVLLVASASTALGQAVTTPNQIVGEVRLQATNPAILQVLAPPPAGLGEGLDAGTSRSFMAAASVGPGPVLRHSTRLGPASASGASAAYDLTVESNAAGIAYSLTPDIWLDHDNDSYELSPSLLSAPVYPEPAADVEVDFEQCLGMVEIRYECADGTPIPWNGGWLRAYRNLTFLQAESRTLPWRRNVERLAVHGGAPFRVHARALIQTGSNPELDLIQLPLECERDVVVDCDELEIVTCTFACGGSGGPGAPLGRIVGSIDVEGEAEHYVSDGSLARVTYVLADDGPHGNRRLDVLREPPHSGAFALENLLPDTVRGWKLDGCVFFGLGHDAERIDLPVLGSAPNPRVPVASGSTTDVGDVYVIDPGLLRGDVVLAGPGGARPSLLTSLRRDADRWPTGVPDHASMTRTGVTATGTGTIVPPSTLSASGAKAVVGIDGGMAANGRDWIGDYDLRLGGPHRLPAEWDASTMRLLLDNRSASEPQSYVHEQLAVDDLLAPDYVVGSGSLDVLDRRHCVSEIELGYVSTSGVFKGPMAAAVGTHAGTDFEGRTVSFSYTATGIEGTPTQGEPPTTRGRAMMVLPEGVWTIFPSVISVSPRGVESLTRLPQLDLQVGCRQSIRLVPDLVPQMDTLPGCATDPVQPVRGGFQSRHDVVDMRWWLNDGTPIVLCSPCGRSPDFAFDVTLVPCENAVTVEATDDAGNVASVTGFVTNAPEPAPAERERLLWPPNHGYWCFTDVESLLGLTGICRGGTTLKIVGCGSDQPDDATSGGTGPQGDGSTAQDCLVAADGRGACVRAERLGSCPAGRTYSLAVELRDECGNDATISVPLRVPHDVPADARDVVVPSERTGPNGTPSFATVPEGEPDADLASAGACR